jgi:hypothetical protein
MKDQLENFKVIGRHLKDIQEAGPSNEEQEKLLNLEEETQSRDQEFNDLMTKYKQICNQKITNLDSMRDSTFIKDDSVIGKQTELQVDNPLLGEEVLDQHDDVNERQKNIEKIQETVKVINENSKKIKQVGLIQGH